MYNTFRFLMRSLCQSNFCKETVVGIIRQLAMVVAAPDFKSGPNNILYSGIIETLLCFRHEYIHCCRHKLFTFMNITSI